MLLGGEEHSVLLGGGGTTDHVVGPDVNSARQRLALMQRLDGNCRGSLWPENIPFSSRSGKWDIFGAHKASHAFRSVQQFPHLVCPGLLHHAAVVRPARSGTTTSSRHALPEGQLVAEKPRYNLSFGEGR